MSLPNPGQRAATAAPGWYPDPVMAATQRYWDGERWTDHVAPAPLPRPAPDHANTHNLELWGWVGALVFPIVGVVIGIMLVNRPGKNAGGLILGFSICWIVVVWVALAASQPSYY